MTRDNSPTKTRRLRVTRAVSATMLALTFGAMVAVVPGGAPARAATSSSELTVKWNADTSNASSFQPDRLSSSPHYNEMKNISISVSQTTGLIDQAIRVRVSGFAGTTSRFNVATNAQNFLQAMQCWGPNPLAADFYETCQWGGRYSGSGVGSTLYEDNILRVASKDNDPFRPTTFDNPFRTVDGQTIPGKNSLSGGVVQYPILSFFGPSTTNEVSSARVGSDGTGFFDFETQSSDQAPQMGCGATGQTRCWLVVVPRGTKFGGDGAECSGFQDSRNNYDYYTYGRSNSVQVGSPVNPKCDYFDNRIVVPLDFTPTGVTCPVGNAEFRVSGSQLMVGAMSSWQPSLCQTVKSTFSFATNTDSIARAQLLETGANTPQIIYSGYPVSSFELESADERTLLAKTAFQYAPVAVSSIVIAYFAEFESGRQESLVITPRMMAKILTQSYSFLVPSSTSAPDKNIAHLSASAKSYNYWNKDPDFQQNNPTNWEEFEQESPSIVLPGPSGADGIKQVWRWILADKDAVDFLDGKPDPWGMTINPYYLPKGEAAAVVPWYLDSNKDYIATPVQRAVGQSNLDGTARKLSSIALDTFPKDDEGVVPLQISIERSRFDTLQFAPYALDFLSATRQAFRGDPNSRTVWDATRINAAGEAGDWVSSGIQQPGSKFMIAVTDSNSASRYGLTTASITAPNSRIIVASTNDSMTAALGALSATSLDSVLQVDPAKVTSAGYPLTIVTYAGVNLTKSTAASRATMSQMLKQITTTGQVQGAAVGELPAGYVPLTPTLQAQANVAASAIQNYVPAKAGSAVSTTNQTYSSEDGFGDPNAAAGGDTDPTVTTGVDGVTDERTAASASNQLQRSGLAISLAVGLLGCGIAPLVLRGRGLL